jgi:dihydrolipoamide dehydrogenase
LFGIRVRGYDIDFNSIIKRVADSVDQDSREIEVSFRGSDNPVLFKSECRFIAHKTLRVGNDAIKADRILVASGGKPLVPNIEGLHGSDFITSDEALRLKKQPRVLTILGGGYISVELAHFFGSLGTEVNIVEKHNTLVYREDEEIAQKFTEIFKQRHNVLTGFEPVKVAKKGDDFEVAVKGTMARPR